MKGLLQGLGRLAYVRTQVYWYENRHQAPYKNRRGMNRETRKRIATLIEDEWEGTDLLVKYEKRREKVFKNREIKKNLRKYKNGDFC